MEVIIKKIDIVVPETPIQQQFLPLSNLDLLLLPFNASAYFCYKQPLDEKHTFEFIVSILKNALAKTLVPLNPLAGELVQNSLGEAEILCNNKGVEFFEAYADVELAEIDFYNTDEGIGKLVPSLRLRGLVSFQVTKLKCGGIVVGCTVDHRVTDGYSAHLFMQSWIEAARGKSFPLVPSFDRSLLSPLHSNRCESLVKDHYIPSSAMKEDVENNLINQYVSRTYYIKSEEIEKLEEIANGDENKEKQMSKFEAFSAFLWKTMALSVEKGKSKMCRLAIVVDGRLRLGGEDSDKLMSLLAYYGNVLSCPFLEVQSDTLIERPLSWIANKINNFILASGTKEHFLGLIDFVEAHRPQKVLPKVHFTSVQDDGPAVGIAAGHQFPVVEMDFGWGCSVFSSNYLPVKGITGYVGTMPSVAANGDWIVYMNLLKEHLDFLETHAAHVFKPLTSDYLNISRVGHDSNRFPSKL